MKKWKAWQREISSLAWSDVEQRRTYSRGWGGGNSGGSCFTELFRSSCDDSSAKQVPPPISDHHPPKFTRFGLFVSFLRKIQGKGSPQKIDWVTLEGWWVGVRNWRLSFAWNAQIRRPSKLVGADFHGRFMKLRGQRESVPQNNQRCLKMHPKKSIQNKKVHPNIFIWTTVCPKNYYITAPYLWTINFGCRNVKIASHMRGFQRFLETFRGPLRDPLRGRFPSQRLSVLLPLIVLPLETPTKIVLEPKLLQAICVISVP